MDSQSQGTSSKKQRDNMNDIKDTAATVSTVAGGGLAVMGINEWLTFALLVTGIVLNIVRIRAIKKSNKEK
jgi:hypothetical protein